MSTISDILDRIKGHSMSAVDSVEQALQKAEAASDHNVFISIDRERALERARAIDARLENGEEVGKLAGVPFVVKDNFLTLGTPTTAAANILKNFMAPLQATAVEKLEAVGAICIGKANLDAFAHGGSTENSAFGVTQNAIDQTRVAGGSSGGSAVAVALDIVPFALGSDTGGSIRQPAAFNGVYGIKPTYGAVSRFGVVAMANSTDTIGCLATSVDDVAMVMDIISGVDPRDMTSVDGVYNSDTAGLDRKLRIGVVGESLTDDVQAEIRDQIGMLSERLTALGHEVTTVSLPIIRYALAMYYIIMPAEVSSNLARYDGVRYGVRASDVHSLAELYDHSRSQGLEFENKRRIMIGNYVLSSGYFDAYYNKAQRARTLLIDAFQQLFVDYDLLLMPTTPSTAFKIGEKTDDPIKMYLADIMTVPASLAGLPALSVPCGSDHDGLPIGAQLIAPMKQDELLLGLAKQLEAAL